MACGILVASGACTHAAAQISYETRFLSDTVAPGAGSGVTFSRFSRPAINAFGDITFYAELIGTGVTEGNNTGIWSDVNGTVGLVAREGEPAPGPGPSGVFGELMTSLGSPYIDDSGDVAFRTSIDGPGLDGTNNFGVWSQSVGVLGQVARAGQPAPGTGPDNVFLAIDQPIVFNPAGDIAFAGRISGTGVDSTNDTGIWVESGGSLGLVVRTAQAAPGTDAGVVFSDLVSARLNGSGDIVFNGFLSGTGVDATNNEGIWSTSQGALGLVARVGDAAPGMGPGITFSDFRNEAYFNDAGDVAFEGVLSGTDRGTNNDVGLWAGQAGSLRLVAQEGVAAPGAGQGAAFATFIESTLNGAGDMAFVAFLKGGAIDNGNNTGVWAESDGDLRLVAREGEQAPGVEAGVVFNSFSSSLMFNDSGIVVFAGSVMGTGVDTSNQAGIWATDNAGELQLILRNGDVLDVNDDPLIQDLRTVDFFNYLFSTGGEEGLPTSLNGEDQLALRVGFTDGSEGIVVVTVPEPGSLALLGLAGLLLTRRRNRR